MGLAAISQALVKSHHFGVVDGRGEGGHEEHVSGAAAAAPNMSGSLESAAVCGEGGNADEERHLAMGQSAEFAHPGDQGGGVVFILLRSFQIISQRLNWFFSIYFSRY